MLYLIIGIILGAAFSPFWMSVGGWIKLQAKDLWEKYGPKQ